MIELTLEGEQLTISSTGAPVEVEFGPEFQGYGAYERPTVIQRLNETNSSVVTAESLRSKITITPEGDPSARLLIVGRELKPLTLSSEQVAALRMGIDLMRPNVRAAYRDGVVYGLEHPRPQSAPPLLQPPY